MLIPTFNRLPSNESSVAVESTPTSDKLVRIQSVHCGSYHSVAVDTAGVVWTWGARGGACLGHADSDILEASSQYTSAADSGGTNTSTPSYHHPSFWKDRLPGIFPIHTAEPKIMIPYELLRWCRGWSTPRPLHLLDTSSTASSSTTTTNTTSRQIIQVSAGDTHTALLLSNGQLFLCGSGVVVPPILTNGISSQASMSTSTTDVKDVYETVDSFRQPHALWLPSLSTRNVLAVYSGNTRLYAILAEDNIAHTLTQPLLMSTFKQQSKSSFSSTATITNDNDNDNNNDNEDDEEIDSASAFLTDTELFQLLDRRGMSDCLLIAGGRTLFCHRAVLAGRSTELRDMIELELPSGFNTNTASASGGLSEASLVQVLLPELQYVTAKALLYYIYTDTLPQSCVSNINMLQSLLAISQTLKMVSNILYAFMCNNICSHYLLTYYFYSLDSKFSVKCTRNYLFTPRPLPHFYMAMMTMMKWIITRNHYCDMAKNILLTCCRVCLREI